MIVNDVFARSRFFLNDNINFFTDIILLEAIKSANDELSDELLVNGVAIDKMTSRDILVLAGAKELTLPDDLIVPVRLWERAETGNDEYTPMSETDWDIESQVGNELNFWNWRNQKVNFIGCKVNRRVRIDYIRTLLAIVGVNSETEVTGSLNYLAYKTAALAVESRGNTVEADRLNGLAYKHLNRLLQIGVRNKQGVIIRRKPFRMPRVRRFF